MHLQIIIQIVSLNRLILSGDILLSKSGQQIKLRGDINGVVVDILEKEIKEGDHVK
jgi:ethanolamine utilization cobalamin adenosyltransferase